jgi:hypothetical protein
MNFKLVSKNNMGVVIILVLVILLSQSKFFNFLTESSLGRVVLLSFVILIAYTNKILGLLAVLCIIIAFNIDDMNVVQSYNYYEGFDGSGNIMADISGNIIADVSGNSLHADKVKLKLKEDKAKLMNAKIQLQQQKANNASQTATTTSSVASTTESFRGIEGFNMSDRETNILRGKQSNAVSVFNDSRAQNDDVRPSDKSIFTSDYSSF